MLGGVDVDEEEEEEDEDEDVEEEEEEEGTVVKLNALGAELSGCSKQTEHIH